MKWNDGWWRAKKSHLVIKAESYQLKVNNWLQWKSREVTVTFIIRSTSLVSQWVILVAYRCTATANCWKDFLILFCTVHFQEFVYVFCFDSCKTSQNVTFWNYLVISKSHFNHHYDGFRALLCSVLSDISFTWWNNFIAVKIKKMPQR